MKDDIDRFAEQAGFPARRAFSDLSDLYPRLERFAAFVRADEREACARVCASMVSNDADWDSHHWNQAVQRCEFAIRARGQA
jgi:hypothetical protein